MKSCVNTRRVIGCSSGEECDFEVGGLELTNDSRSTVEAAGIDCAGRQSSNAGASQRNTEVLPDDNTADSPTHVANAFCVPSVASMHHR
jgi:hypothetical protein